MLPIEPILPALRSALASHRAAVLEAPPGAGKTTRVPLALYQEEWLAGRKIIMLEPRRLATRAAAHRMASTLGERAGETVGYRMRDDTRVGPRTRIEVVTEGVLTRMLQHDLALQDAGLVIFDEFHERSLAGDTGLALTLAASESLRDDLRILVMSATLDGTTVARLLGDAPVIRSEGRVWPVITKHAPPRSNQQHLTAHVTSVIRDAIATEPGSILVFLPGAGEIRRVEEQLHRQLPSDVAVYPLHGSLPMEQQDAAIAPTPAGRRKVVLATSIAETSLTIDGIRIVIDSGEMRIPRFSARTGMTRLETVRVTRASADQRRGRAGRLEPGVCIRCWSAGEDAGLVPFTRAEILDADLASLVLDLAAAGFTDPAELKWLDPPPAAAYAQGRELLQLLDAIDGKGQLTAHGESMARLGMHPRLAHMTIKSNADPKTIENVVEILEGRERRAGIGAGPPPVDIELRMAAAHGGASSNAAHGGAPSNAAHGGAPLLGMMLALAYPDRIAQRRDTPGRFLLRNGRGAMLASHDPLAQAEWIVAAQIDDAGREGRITLAAQLDIDEYLEAEPDQVRIEDIIAWNDATRSVAARRRTMLGALVLKDAALLDADPETIRQELIKGIGSIGIAALPWSDGPTALRLRMAFMHHHDATWPAVDDASLQQRIEEWLGPRLGGIRKTEELARVDLADALRQLLTWEQRRAIDELAPERIAVPTGSQIRVDYSDASTPTLAVRLQELFGLMRTPTVGRNVPVTMELLSPGYRPVQVTRDLASFWKTGYFDVRKDLRGRYPKHHWPEDPLAAEPVRGAKRRK